MAFALLGDHRRRDLPDCGFALTCDADVPAFELPGNMSKLRLGDRRRRLRCPLWTATAFWSIDRHFNFAPGAGKSWPFATLWKREKS